MPFEDLPNLETGRNMPPQEETGEEAPVTEAIKRVADEPLAPEEQQPEVQAEAPQDTQKTEREPQATGDPKLQSVIDKYGGSLEEIAKAALSAQQKMTVSSQEKSALERELQQMRSQLQNLQMSMQQPKTQGAQAQQLSAPDVERLNEEMWTKPYETFQKILDMREAQKESQRRTEEFNDYFTHNQSDIQKHQQTMNDLYFKNPAYYDSLPPKQATAQLLETAKQQELYSNASSFIAQLQNAGYRLNASQGQQNVPQNSQNTQFVGSGIPSNVVGQQDLRTRELYKRVIDSGGKDDWQLANYLASLGVAEHIK